MTSPYRSAAPFYVSGRPPYSASLVPEIAARLGLDGTGAYLDAGCGPGILALAFAPRFASVVGLDPSPEMLAAAPVVPGVRWVLGRAEDIPVLAAGPFRLVTFGQSYHWTDRPRVAAIVHDVLVPGGAMAVINHVPSDSPPAGPGLPPIPHDAIDDLLARYPGVGQRRLRGDGVGQLGAGGEGLGLRGTGGEGVGVRRAGGEGVGLRGAGGEGVGQRGAGGDEVGERGARGDGASPPRHEIVLAASPFGPPERIVLPGRADLIRTPDDILANLYSTSFAAPDRFGERRGEFEEELRALLARESADGLFWEWPGDTEILLAQRAR